jgi:hypothetical protein
MRRRPSLLLRLPYRCLVRDHGCGGSMRGAWLLRVGVVGVGPGCCAAGYRWRPPSRSRHALASTHLHHVASLPLAGRAAVGGTTPSRCPLLLAADRSRSVSAPTLPLTIVDLLLGRFDLSMGPVSRAGGCTAFGRDGLSSPRLIFPSVRGKEIREGGGSSARGTRDCTPQGSSAAVVFLF